MFNAYHWFDAYELFKSLHPDCNADLDGVESYDGYLVIYIDTPEGSARYVFDSMEDFCDWARGVVID